MKKIAIILEDMRIGGPQKQLIYFLQQTIKKKTNHRYLIIAPKNSKNEFSKFFDLKKIEIIELDIQYLSAYSIVNYIKSFFLDFNVLSNCFRNIEKIYIAGGSSNLKSLLVSAILKKKIYFHIHDTKSNFFIKFTLLVLSRFIKKIFFASKFSKDYYSFLNAKPKKIVLRSSVNTSEFKIRKKRKKDFKVGIIANINPDKNLELLIEIIDNINDKDIKFELIGNLFSSQKKYFIKNLSKINKLQHKLKWKKNIFHPKKDMKNFDILISTSYQESLPLSIIEALSMSIPVISTNVGDVAYVLKKNKCGFIVNPEISEYIDIIKMLKLNKKKLLKYSSNARKNILNNFDIKDYHKKMEKELFL